MSKRLFGRTADGTPVYDVGLSTPSGCTASVISFGAALRDLHVPLPGGERRRVVLGFPTLDGYLNNPGYIGVTAGRHASRIRDGRLRLDGRDHQLSLNDRGRHHLHGGAVGFSQRPWTVLDHDDASVTLGLVSPDGDQGYPGGVEVRCTYRLVEPATLRVTMTGVADATTVLNLAHHSYFCLDPGKTLAGHRLLVWARHAIASDADLIPTGAIHLVESTPLDFRSPRPLADPAHPCDDVFVLDRQDEGLFRAAALAAPDGRVSLEVHTTEPCLIVYDGAKLSAPMPGHDGATYGPYGGLCLEAIRMPDATHNPWFSACILRAGDRYRQVTEYRFLTAAEC